ncbi:phosphoglucomutase (alpha-D-glucose-1,6-bisphosphate-dependent) [uncultured Phenylobacterium sp.]|uniref:phosphoglucomutase (alpha-D-glucose-1,6-bisphosphate-dependent) n=1 Tax=uncultured Phenylobacterium sp. TaxID=349273 RepID=UPI0025E7B4EE|nr:phosphoglucomutase (alpha-D-glucose-1,6-bisphosphate-dependent) [uncultured Phenylobacterium sp.]
MTGNVDPRAGKPVDPASLLDVGQLLGAYYAGRPDPAQPAQRVSFGTSGHRGSAFDTAFNEAHILAIAQAICLDRKARGVDGPLFVGIDTHALSAPAFKTALEVFVANGVTTMIDAHGGYTPTPVISHAILSFNRDRTRGLADGVVITPSHNPPADGGIKYNPPHGGPADTDTTSAVEHIANAFIKAGLAGVRRVPYERARASAEVRRYDYISPYVADLENVLDMAAIAASGVKIGIDPLGGAAVRYWAPIIDRYRLNATLVSEVVDPTFGFMTADWDGQIRMDCSSPYAMARLVGLSAEFDIAFGNDTDADRHGIVTPSQGLMNPNHYLAAAISYLFGARTAWPRTCAVGKTMVTSAMLDRLALKVGRPVIETPVGFRWFVDGLGSGAIGFAGEESAGASFLRRDGTVWTTEKDGLLLGLLAAEITASSGRSPSELYGGLTQELGASFYERTDAPATRDQKAILGKLQPDQVTIARLAGEPLLAVESAAPGGAPLGGIRVRTRNGWFAARPSGTEDVYKIYAESFVSGTHLQEIQREAGELIGGVFERTEPPG